jgi:hypothetical protein
MEQLFQINYPERIRVMVEENMPKTTQFRGKLTFGDTPPIPCAVLDNGKRIVTENGITVALLGSRSGGSKRIKKAQQGAGAPIPLFLAPNNLKPFISQELLSGPLQAIEYKDGGRIKRGYDASVLPIVCDVWLRAREADALQDQQLEKAQKAEILMRGLAHVGIIALVDEATGYQDQRDRDELQRFLALYLSEERLKWAKMFPDEYYRQLFRLQGWQYSPLSVRRPKLVGVLTNKLVYEKLPAPVLDELRRLNPVKNKRTWRREATFFQHLSADIGQPDLRDHLLQLIAIMRASPNWASFKRLFARAFPGPEGYQVRIDDDAIDV